MRKKALIVVSALTVLTCVTGCSSMIKTVDNSAYDVVDSYDYSGMRDQDEYFDPLEEKRNIDRGLYKGEIKEEAMAYKIDYPTEPETTEAETKSSSEESKEFIESVYPTGKKYTGSYDTAKKDNTSKSNNTNSSINNNSSNSSTTKKNNTSSITVDDSSSKSSNSSSSKSGYSSDNDDTPEKRRNPASIIVNGSKYDTYITIEGYYRGNKAITRLNRYNSKNTIEYNMDIPKGYEPVIVEFTVTAGENTPNSKKILIPDIKVRDSSGSSFDEVPTYVNVMRMGSYSDDNNETKSYEAVFEMPEDEDGFQLIFGSTNGNTYRFKSSSLDESTNEDD